ncbi:hypothetical protein LC092_05275 [Stappia stellulata]|uniref:hypothetical protein n=1 Tax=Stappia stellulata TaxID=71235 RepID=UPI001CD725DB|nr:hypothetical protein [Stappia stellulata]MCA1241838.1 hypothetical protein [Stappia stellulata]
MADRTASKVKNFKDLAQAIQPRTAPARPPKPEIRPVRPAEFFLSNRWRFA